MLVYAARVAQYPREADPVASAAVLAEQARALAAEAALAAAIASGRPVFTLVGDGIDVTIASPEWCIDADGDPRLLAGDEALPAGATAAVAFYDADGDLNVVVPGGLT